MKRKFKRDEDKYAPYYILGAAVALIYLWLFVL